MKLKQQPTDFIVNEILDIKISSKKGDYLIYKLKKESCEFFSVVRKIARTNDVPYSEIGFAGIKDKYALTTQYLSVPSKYPLVFSDKKVSLKFAGYSNSPIKRGELKGNNFKITVRGIDKKGTAQIRSNLTSLKQGIPNYFDSQRFGSMIDSKFVAKYLLKEEYAEAVKLYLTPREGELQEIFALKQKILKNWGNSKNLNISDETLNSIIKKGQKSWLEAFKLINSFQKEMFIAAYQSYLWNECLKLIMQDNSKELKSIPYAAGKLFFNSDKLNLPLTTLSTINDKPDFNPIEEKYVKRVLKKEKLEFKDFDISKTGNYFTSFNRELVIIPKKFVYSKFIKDELNSKKGDIKFKLVLDFFLQKGSYATIIVKKVLGR